MVPPLSRVLLSAAALALLAIPAAAQRPALTGEKAQVAEAVKADLTRLSELQTAHHNRTRVYAADARDLGFNPTSGATINIAYASMNAWAANASHPVLSPVSCFIIISSAEPTGPAAQPFCQEGRPGSGTVAGTPPSGAPTTPQTTPQTAPQTQPRTQPATPTQQPTRNQPAPTQPTQTPRTQQQTPPTTGAAPTVSTPNVSTTPSQPAREVQQPRTQQQAPSTPVQRQETGMTPSRPAQPLPAATPSTQTAQGQGRATTSQPTGPLSTVPASALAGTRDIDIAGITVPTLVENVSPQQFSQKLNDFAQGATTMYAELQARNESIVRDPYESTAEFEARRAAAFEATQRREREFFQQNSKTYNVALPVREVRYDPDREIFEFTVDGLGLPITRSSSSEPGTLTLTCFSRPVFWCSTEAGMVYEAGDMWRIPRATARQNDILRTPLTLVAQFAVGRRNDAPVLSISLLSMDLQARGQSVSRWDGASR